MLAQEDRGVRGVRDLASLFVPMVAALCIFAFLVHVLTDSRYGYFRDELYILDCGAHLDWGFVDHPPLIALLAFLAQHTVGVSLPVLRAIVGISAMLKVLLAAMIAREFGGGRFAQGLACLCVVLMPVYLVEDNQFSMNTLEPLFWMGCVYVLLVAFRKGDLRLLIWFGVLAGLGLENKDSILMFGAAAVVGLLLTPQRRVFLSAWMWLAGLVAFAIFLPNLLWQVGHGWPTIQFLHNVSVTHKNVELPPLQFEAEQVLMTGPLSILVWLPGLWFLLFDREGKRFRYLGILFVALLAMMMYFHAKDYYVAPVYVLLYAAGAVFWETRNWAHNRRPGRVVRWTRAVRIVLPALQILFALPVFPIALPILPYDKVPGYEQAIRMHPPKTEVAQSSPLPTHFADMFGWRGMVEKIAEAYNALPADERAEAAIFTNNYGEASAVDLFGAKYGLPKAISGHNSFWLWGPRGYTGDVMILVQMPRKFAEQHCATVTDGPEVSNPWGMAYENFRIYTCHGLHPALPELWPDLKHWQ